MAPNQIIPMGARDDGVSVVLRLHFQYYSVRQVVEVNTAFNFRSCEVPVDFRTQIGMRHKEFRCGNPILGAHSRRHPTLPDIPGLETKLSGIHLYNIKHSGKIWQPEFQK